MVTPVSLLFPLFSLEATLLPHKALSTPSSYHLQYLPSGKDLKMISLDGYDGYVHGG